MQSSEDSTGAIDSLRRELSSLKLSLEAKTKEAEELRVCLFFSFIH